LAPPDLGSSRYLITGGYAAYVEDYKLYVGALSELKASAKSVVAQKKLPRLEEVITPQVVTEMKKYTLLLSDQRVGEKAIASQSEPFVTPFPFSYGKLRFSVDTNQGLNGQYVTLYNQSLDVAPPAATRYLSFTTKIETYQGTTERVDPVYMVIPPATKGPAVTPKKVRTPEETAERLAKEKARKEKSMWFAEKRDLLAKGKAEEKLAESAAKRARFLRAVDRTVDTHAAEDGWNVVVSKRPRKQKVKSVTQSQGKRVVVQETRTVS